jgi:hypothetical protein
MTSLTEFGPFDITAFPVMESAKLRNLVIGSLDIPEPAGCSSVLATDR